jgi:hypothetical protein
MAQKHTSPGTPVVAFMALLVLGTASTARAQDCNVLEVTNTTASATPTVCAFDSVKNAAAGTNVKHVLLYDWSNGGHSRIHTQRHMMRLAKKYGFRLDRSQTNTYITPATLQGVDIVVFNNGDQDPLSNATSLAAMRNFIEEQGKGMLAIHAALAFIPCPNEDVTVESLTTCRWFLRAYRTQYWYEMNHTSSNRVRIYADSVQPGEVPPNALGVDAVPAIYSHGRRNAETRNIFENLPLNGSSGSLANRPYIWEGIWDEFAAYRNHPRRAPVGVYGGVDWGPVNILISLDENSYSNSAGCNAASPCKTGDRPVSWTRKVGKGLAAFNHAGHGDVYVRTRLVNGIVVDDSLMEKYNWRLMKYLARDFVGCMNPASPNYNPEATVTGLTASDHPDPCNQVTGLQSGSVRQPVPLISARAGIIRVSLQGMGTHTVRITDVKGRGVYSAVRSGDGVPVMTSRLRPGFYFVGVTSPGGAKVTRRVLVN